MIFLTGGTGLVGLHVLEELRGRGHRVLALARTPAAAAELARRGAVTVAGDAGDPAPWDRVGGVSAIIHASAIISSSGGWAAYTRVNVEATRLAARRARQLGVPLIHVSSVAVYGPKPDDLPDGLVGEDFPFGALAEGEFYARSKRLAEAAVWAEVAAGLRAVALRPCVIYGPGDRYFLPRLVQSARRGWFPVVGAATRPMALVHAANVAQGIVAALGDHAGWGRPFNLTNDDSVSPRELVALVAEGLGRHVRVVTVPPSLARRGAAAADLLLPFLRPGAPASFRAVAGFLAGGNPYSSNAARAVLGWRPSTRHSEGIPRAVRAI
jgi:nucleoside-diphosphate-sugar epimerase